MFSRRRHFLHEAISIFEKCLQVIQIIKLYHNFNFSNIYKAKTEHMVLILDVSYGVSQDFIWIFKIFWGTLKGGQSISSELWDLQIACREEKSALCRSRAIAFRSALIQPTTNRPRTGGGARPAGRRGIASATQFRQYEMTTRDRDHAAKYNFRYRECPSNCPLRTAPSFICFFLFPISPTPSSRIYAYMCYPFLK